MRRIALLAAFVSFPAAAYNEAIHVLITRKALESRSAWIAEPLLPPSGADLAAFRTLFWRTASAAKDAALRDEFLARFPTEASFDSWSFKELLTMNPAARVHGFDAAPDESGPLPRGRVLELASRWPDDDARNRDRLLRDPRTREVAPGQDGNPLPYDPATLDFGALTGTTSQGHAHYALVREPLSDDPEVLQNEPWRFAVPRTAHAWGAELAQIYTDLALLAAGSRLPSAEWLVATHAGAAFHHLQDASNQIHTVQVGIYEFFRSAFIQSKLRDLRTLGGVLGERRSLRQIGLRLIANHHLLSEDLYAKRVSEPQIQASLAQLSSDDPAIAAAGSSAAAFGGALADAIVAVSSREAPEVYRLTFALSAPTLRDGMGHEYDGSTGDDPDAYVVAGHPALPAFYEIEGRGLRRAATAVRAWTDRLAEARRRPGAGDEAVLRILAVVLPYHRAAAERRRAWSPAAGERHGIAWGYPLGAAGIVVLAAAVALRRRRA